MIFEHVELGWAPERKGDSRRLFQQVHGRRVLTVENPRQREEMADHPEAADGAVTRVSGLTLQVYSADCIPVLLFTAAPEGPVAAVHSGWRGTAQGIVPEARRHFSSWNPELHVWIGPCIQACCFEIRDDFLAAFREAGHTPEPYVRHRDNRKYFDLVGFLRRTQLGDLPDSRIHTEEMRCTVCSEPPLPSYRRNGNTETQIRTWIRKTVR